MEPIQVSFADPQDVYFDQDVARIIMEEETVAPMIKEDEPGNIFDHLPEM